MPNAAIDPVTGLPVVGVPDIVDQIPLGVEPRPWNDLKATDRPPHAPLYPDDMLNTLAVGVGMQGDQGRAFTMSDDNGILSLNVHQTNQSGGGGGPAQVVTIQSNNGWGGGATSVAGGPITSDLDESDHAAQYLYGCGWHVDAQIQSTDTSGHLYIQMYGGGPSSLFENPTLQFLAQVDWPSGLTFPYTFTSHRNIIFPFAVDWKATWPLASWVALQIVTSLPVVFASGYIIAV